MLLLDFYFRFVLLYLIFSIGQIICEILNIAITKYSDHNDGLQTYKTYVIRSLKEKKL